MVDAFHCFRHFAGLADDITKLRYLRILGRYSCCLRIEKDLFSNRRFQLGYPLYFKLEKLFDNVDFFKQACILILFQIPFFARMNGRRKEFYPVCRHSHFSFRLPAVGSKGLDC